MIRLSTAVIFTFTFRAEAREVTDFIVDMKDEYGRKSFVKGSSTSSVAKASLKMGMGSTHDLARSAFTVAYALLNSCRLH